MDITRRIAVGEAIQSNTATCLGMTSNRAIRTVSVACTCTPAPHTARYTVHYRKDARVKACTTEASFIPLYDNHATCERRSLQQVEYNAQRIVLVEVEPQQGPGNSEWTANGKVACTIIKTTCGLTSPSLP